MQRLDHGVIGNGRVIALVAPDSGIEWLCLPRFDSPSVFGAIVDQERGGAFRFRCGDRVLTGTQQYLANTNVLRTVFEDGDASWEVIDFAPRIALASYHFDTPAELVRIVRPITGTPRITVEFAPRPDYGRATPAMVSTPHGIEVLGGAVPLNLFANVPGEQIVAGLDIALRHPLYFMLSHGSRKIPPVESEYMLMLEETVRMWRIWAKTCALPSFAPAAVLRSALCMKLHCYADTGAIIAAATTSIPEALGTPRTWDYRYCWLRDAAFVVEAMRRLSHLYEGERFIAFLRDMAESGPLQPLYGIAGERELPEIVLGHLRGWNHNGPVRIGNAAAIQQQNDLDGELVLCLQTILGDPRVVFEGADALFPLIARLVEQSIATAPLADTGIWEFRTLPRHYTFSRAMCWAAIQRGSELATQFGHHDLAKKWKAIADDEKAVVLDRGFNRTLGMFTQELDGDAGDAAMLLFPTIGIIDAKDPRFLSTLDHYGTYQTHNGLMKRYTNLDDFGPTTSAFTMCSFWWAEALALAGRLDQAVEVFERVLAHANPLGLFSEDIEPETGQLLGNFPQAYTHVGLVHAAMTIGELLDARDGRVRAWGKTE
ncbi:MAG TPA: glycoside hydrolase family 15 protein [Kofleriaceae bacterium]|jgi:GH15 family glucan-1,4-alpha-glucosidase|nr:glycoside hydrolase family 15 protein [Kofleriaceae bacterium]